MNYATSNILSLKCRKLRFSGSKDIGVSKFELVAKTQFLKEEMEILIIIDQTKLKGVFEILQKEGC